MLKSADKFSENVKLSTYLVNSSKIGTNINDPFHEILVFTGFRYKGR